jgi:hypothetical protein
VHVPIDNIAFVIQVAQLLLADPEQVLQVVSHIFRLSLMSLIPQDSSVVALLKPPMNFSSKVVLV